MEAPYVPKWELFAYVCSSGEAPESIIERATDAKSGKNVLLVLKHEGNIGRRIGSAYLGMMVRFNDKLNRYDKRSLEMLMLLYSDKEIGRKAHGFKIDNSRFILFSDSRKLFDGFVKKNGIRKISKLDICPDFSLSEIMQ
jgi:hypothetical protein